MIKKFRAVAWDKIQGKTALFKIFINEADALIIKITKNYKKIIKNLKLIYLDVILKKATAT